MTCPPAAAGLRLDQALAAALPQYSRARLQRWIRAGAVRADGQAGARARPRPGRRADSWCEARVRRRHARGGRGRCRCDIVYEDAALLVLNKPAGLVVHPGAGNREHTLQNALLAHDPALARVPRAGLVHRLDKDTSGLLMVARTPEAHTRLVAALAAREIGREYLALCAGAPTGGGRIDQPIGRHRSRRTRMAVRARWARGRHALPDRGALSRPHAAARAAGDRAHAPDPGASGARRACRSSAIRSTAAGRAAGRRTPALNAALQCFRRQALHAQRLRSSIR